MPPAEKGNGIPVAEGGHVVEQAPAKINLALHVTARRENGYHELDSLVAPAAVADLIEVRAAEAFSLVVTPEGAVPAGRDNIALRAAMHYGRLVGRKGARIRLEKRLPVAAGIGGGSSDAAAVIRALSRLWNTPLPPAEALLPLGADVPVCLTPRPWRMRGVGERLTPAPLPRFDLVLVNPRRPVPTGAVFRRLARADNPPLPPLPQELRREIWFDWLSRTRNDLEPAARAAFPEIGAVAAALEGCGAPLLVRMSGSGGTVFAIHADARAAQRAAEMIRAACPGWWVVATHTLEG